jgi:hypothetical protein
VGLKDLRLPWQVFPPFYLVLKKGKERKRNRKERKGGA